MRLRVYLGVGLRDGQLNLQSLSESESYLMVFRNLNLKYALELGRINYAQTHRSLWSKRKRKEFWYQKRRGRGDASLFKKNVSDAACFIYLYLYHMAFCIYLYFEQDIIVMHDLTRCSSACQYGTRGK